MNREPRSKVIETEEKRTIIFDEQTQAEVWAIIFKIVEISQKPLTKQQAENYVLSLLNEFFYYSNDISELEDRITEIDKLLTAFVEKMYSNEFVE